jgi:hypothetical protein
MRRLLYLFALPWNLTVAWPVVLLVRPSLSAFRVCAATPAVALRAVAEGYARVLEGA